MMDRAYDCTMKWLATCALALVACGPRTHSYDGVPGAEPWTPWSVAGATLMTLVFVGSPIALVVWSFRRGKK